MKITLSLPFFSVCSLLFMLGRNRQKLEHMAVLNKIIIIIKQYLSVACQKSRQFQALVCTLDRETWFCLPNHTYLVQTVCLTQLSTILETSILGFKVIVFHKQKSQTTRDFTCTGCTMLSSLSSSAPVLLKTCS